MASYANQSTAFAFGAGLDVVADVVCADGAGAVMVTALGRDEDDKVDPTADGAKKVGADAAAADVADIVFSLFSSPASPSSSSGRYSNHALRARSFCSFSNNVSAIVGNADVIVRASTSAESRTWPRSRSVRQASSVVRS